MSTMDRGSCAYSVSFGILIPCPDRRTISATRPNLKDMPPVPYSSYGRFLKNSPSSPRRRTFSTSAPAPAPAAAREGDAAQSRALAECVLEIARSCLKKNGHLAVKIFQGSGERELLETMRKCFTTAKGFKPQASRSESFETYFIGMGFHPDNLPG